MVRCAHGCACPRVVVMWCADGGAHGATWSDESGQREKSEESIAYTFWPLGELFVALGRATNTNCARGLFGLLGTKNGSAANGKADDAKTAASASKRERPPVDCAAPPTPAGWWR